MLNSTASLRAARGRRISILAVITAGLVVAALPGPAYAEGARPAADDSAPQVSTLQPGGRAFVEPSPAGCVGRTHDPHRSSHVPGTINVVADTRCNYAVPSVGVSTNLYRSRWYGWELRGSSGFQSRANSSSISTNAGSPRCVGDVHDWLGSSYHESIEGGRKYYGNTSKRRDGITC
jgi:hypothetical protein